MEFKRVTHYQQWRADLTQLGMQKTVEWTVITPINNCEIQIFKDPAFTK